MNEKSPVHSYVCIFLWHVKEIFAVIDFILRETAREVSHFFNIIHELAAMTSALCSTN